MTYTSSHWVSRLRQLTMMAAMLALITTTCWANELPELGDPKVAKVTPAKQRAMGRDFMAMIRASGLVLSDPIDNQYLESIGNRLVTVSSAPYKHFQFFWLASAAINAFAGPDGYIGINTALILASRNESELAGVMAHEIGHVVQGHLARRLSDQSKLKLSTIAGMLAAIALGTQSPDAAAGAMSATIAGAQSTILNHSRAHEKEADRVGMEILAKANFNPWAMPQFFERLLQDERLYQKIPQLLNDHPLTQDRIADTENRASLYPKKQYHSSLSYYLVKERIRVQTYPNLHDLLKNYKNILARKTYENKAAAQYGYGLSLMLNHHSKKALEIFENLSHRYPDKLIFKLAIISAEEDLRQFKQAIAHAKQLQQVYPDNYAVMTYHADALLKAGKAKQALALLEDFQLSYPNHPIPYGALAKAQAASGDKAAAYQTRANYLLSIGQVMDAIDQLKMALVVPNIHGDTKERVQAQLKQLQNKIKS